MKMVQLCTCYLWIIRFILSIIRTSVGEVQKSPPFLHTSCGAVRQKQINPFEIFDKNLFL